MTQTIQIINQYRSLSQTLKVLAEPNRLIIFDLLMQGVQCNCELADTLQMAPNLISHHLSVLRKAGLVNAKRDGFDSRWIYYSINRKALQALRATLDTFLDPARIQPRQPECGLQTQTTPAASVKEVV